MTNKPRRPLSQHAVDALYEVSRKPAPAQEYNPGVVNRLLQDDLVECVMMPTPYATRKGDINFLKATEKGMAFIRDRDAAKTA